MADRPILFSGPMVRALLDGRKTQTRRVVKPQPPHDPQHDHVDAIGAMHRWWAGRLTLGKQHEARCPYGQPGDRLWVRETWQGPLIDDDATENPHDIESPKYCFYKADGGPAPEYEDSDGDLHCRWRPSIHMPRWASRITLEITDVRVERLQDISEADAVAEGIERSDSFPGWYRGPLPGDGAELEQAGRDFKIPTAFPKLAYRALWDSINGPGSWDANPWVWVVEFRRMTP